MIVFENPLDHGYLDLDRLVRLRHASGHILQTGTLRLGVRPRTGRDRKYPFKTISNLCDPREEIWLVNAEIANDRLRFTLRK